MFSSQMHELGIAQSILDLVERELAQRPGAQLKSVALRIGDFSGVDTESLTFCFSAIVKDTTLASAELLIERTPDDALDVRRLELEVP